MTFKTRKRLAILVLVVGLPLYIAAALILVGLLGERPPMLVELAIYIGLGGLWALPLRRLFLGVARAEPDPEEDAQ